jgi:two-component system sensor histidine kinase BaeS
MFHTLRRRFILSLVLPVLVVIPLVGLALIYVLETQVLLPNLAHNLSEEAALLANVLSHETDLWSDPDQAQAVIARFSRSLSTRMMLFDTGGHLLAASDPADAEQVGQEFQYASLAKVLAGGGRMYTDYDQHLSAETMTVLAPVVGPDQQVIGVVGLSHEMINVREWFQRSRYLTAGVLMGGLLLGAGVGLVLAIELERPLRQITLAIYQIASDQRLAPLPEQGLQEVGLLAHAVNILAERRYNVEQTSRQLVANLVHELGRPLGAVRAAIHALQNGASENKGLRQELLSGMIVEIESLRHLLNDLSRLNELVAGQLELERRPIFLSQWLSQALSPWREAARGKGLNWEVTVPSDLPTLEVDPDRLDQALGNLLSNAIKYTPPGGTVSVRAGLEDNSVWIRVSDTGPGIGLEDQAHIFTPFYRVKQTQTLPQGMGLGLSIARDLTLAHAGQLEVESTPGDGSHFILRLPFPGTCLGCRDNRTAV